MITNNHLHTDIIDRFVDNLQRKDVHIKDSKPFQGRKQFAIHEYAEEFLNVLGVEPAMSYDLVKKAKEKLEELQKAKTGISTQNSNLYLPEVKIHTSLSGNISYWVKNSASDGTAYFRFAHDLKNPSLLARSLYLYLSKESQQKIMNEVNRVNLTREDNKKISPDSVISTWLDNDRYNPSSILDKEPVSFTTNKDIATRVYIDISTIPLVPKDTPAWDSFTNRLMIEDTDLNGKDYFMAFIWSIFEETDRNRIFLYFYDQGKQGKSEMVNALKYKLGAAYSSFDFFTATSHSTEGLVNVRLIVQNEGVLRKLTAMTLVKQITGGDDIIINPKGRTEFTAKIDAKIISIGNDPPMVSPQLSELSRLLPITVRPRKERDFVENYSEKLKLEIDDFLAKCKIAYFKLKAQSKEETFLSIEKHLENNDSFRDPMASFIDVLKNNYILQDSVFGCKWKTIQNIINKLIESDDSFKGNVTSASPRLLDFLAKWAKKHGGQFIRSGSKKGFYGVTLVKKDEDKKQIDDLGDL